MKIKMTLIKENKVASEDKEVAKTFISYFETKPYFQRD